jgi:hypothetical protein
MTAAVGSAREGERPPLPSSRRSRRRHSGGLTVPPGARMQPAIRGLHTRQRKQTQLMATQSFPHFSTLNNHSGTERRRKAIFSHGQQFTAERVSTPFAQLPRAVSRTEALRLLPLIGLTVGFPVGGDVQ